MANIMKKILISTALAAGLVLSSSAMAGALLTPAQIQGFNFSTLDDNTQLQFDGFDSSLGVLHGVRIEWIMDKTLNNKIININAGASEIGSPNLISATSTTKFSIASGPISLESVNELTTDGFSGFVPGGGVITTVGTKSATDLMGSILICDDGSCLAGGGTTVTAAELNFYIDTINILDVDIENIGSQGGSVPAGVFTGNDGTVAGSVSVKYDYDLQAPANPPTPMPEPSTIALLGLGFSLYGLQGVARRKKQNR